MTTPITIAHLSDLHFGGYADLAQIEALEKFLPTIGAGVTVISGDLSQRARHGEFQAAHAFVERLRAAMPVLVVPGNHDIEWWRSPMGLAGERRKYAKYSRYFGDLRPVLEIPGAIVAGALSSYGVALGSLTWNIRDVAVKGHLPRAETDRVKAIFASSPRVASPDTSASKRWCRCAASLPGSTSSTRSAVRWSSPVAASIIGTRRCCAPPTPGCSATACARSAR